MAMYRFKLVVAIGLFVGGGLLLARSLGALAEEGTVADEAFDLTTLVQPIGGEFIRPKAEDNPGSQTIIGLFVLPVGDCAPPLVTVDGYVRVLQSLLGEEQADLRIALTNEEASVTSRYGKILDLPLPAVTAAGAHELISARAKLPAMGLYLQKAGEPLQYVPLVHGLTDLQRQDLLAYALRL